MAKARANMGQNAPDDAWLAKTVEDVAHRRWLVSDDVEGHIEQIRPYIEWGFDHLVFHFPGDDQERAMALYAEKVLPELRSRFG